MRNWMNGHHARNVYNHFIKILLIHVSFRLRKQPWDTQAVTHPRFTQKHIGLELVSPGSESWAHSPKTKGIKSVIFPPRQSQQRPLPDPHPEQTSLIDPDTFKRVGKQKQNPRTFSAFPCKTFHQQCRLPLNPLLVNFPRSADGLFLVQ